MMRRNIHLAIIIFKIMLLKSGVWEMAQSIKCLLSKHENLSSGPSNLCKNLDMAVPTHNPNTGLNRDRRIFGAPWLASLAKSVVFRFSKIACLKI